MLCTNRDKPSVNFGGARGRVLTYNVRPVTVTLLPAGAPGRLLQSSSLSLETPVGVVCV